jgi:hypothetical protein
MKPTKQSKERHLLATMTGEPFQPARLYYAIPDPSFVIRKLRSLRCMAEAPREQCWEWLFHAEASSLRFVGGYDDVPKERRPVILGWIRFPQSNSMTLQTNSIPRAIEGARFFGSRLGRDVVAMRFRVVNRFFAAEEGQPEELQKTLDHDVAVVDPRSAEMAFRRELEDLRKVHDAQNTVAAFMERRLKGKEDVPMVEDFPLTPEEETPEFQNLATALQLRMVRASEHWQGNTHLTLAAIIVRTFDEKLWGRSGLQGQLPGAPSGE